MSNGYPVDYFDHVHKATSWEVVDFVPEGITVKEWTDTELLDALKQAAADLSFYNAAEGDSWSQERNARARAHDHFYGLKEVAMAKGIYNPDDFKNFLV